MADATKAKSAAPSPDAQPYAPTPRRPSRSSLRSSRSADLPSPAPSAPDMAPLRSTAPHIASHLSRSSSTPSLPSPSTPPSAWTPAEQEHHGPVQARRSTRSLRRKPVPTLDSVGSVAVPLPPSSSGSEVSLVLSNADNSPTRQDDADEQAHASRGDAEQGAELPSEPSIPPPRYVLSTDPPPPTYPAPRRSTLELDIERRAGLPDLGYSLFTPSSPSREFLPSYAVECETEPKTLARALWTWGWLMPLLWGIGMCILWIPLNPAEEETDPGKKQKMEEMIEILRKAELRYAKRCLIAFSTFCALLAVIIVATVVASRK